MLKKLKNLRNSDKNLTLVKSPRSCKNKLDFFKRNHFLLYILGLAHFESFSTYCNKVFFYIHFQLQGLEVTVLLAKSKKSYRTF